MNVKHAMVEVRLPRKPGETSEEMERRNEEHWRKVVANEERLLQLRAKAGIR